MEFDYQQALLEAMNIVAGARINDLPFDRTIVCSIEDASQAAQGHYRVSDGSTTFDAWTEDTHYNIGQRVYVQIPGNDMTSQKHIIGRYFEAENEMLTYVSPEEKEAVVKNIIWGPSNQQIDIAEESEEILCKEQGIEIQSNALDLYNGLRLDVNITCPLGEYTILSGNYGIKIACYYQGINDPVLLYFDSQEDIFGNPYDIEVATSFTQTYFVPSYLDQGDGTKALKYIVPYVYQKGNFLYRDNEGEAQTLDRGTITFNSITISQICDVSIYEDDTALLTASNGLQYTPQRNEENWNGLDKTLNLTFIHKTKDNKSIGFTDGEFTELALDTAYWQDLETSIKALQLDVYEVQATAVINNGLVEESYQSKLTNLEEWRQEVLDNLETKLTQLQVELNKITYAIVWKRNELDGTWKTYEDAYTAESLQVECLPTAQTTEFVVEVWRNGKKIAFNQIVFTNTLDVFGTDVGRKNIDVFLTHGEKSQKTYPFYDAQGHIIQQNNMSVERTLQWGYKASSGYAGTIDNPNEFFKGWKIEWHAPKTATSLRPPQNHKWTSENNEYVYSVIIDKDIAESYLKYTIAEWHIISNVNNTIRCIITDPLGNVYPKEGELKEDFIFSTFGNSGTDYSLVISEKNNKPAYTEGDMDYELQARLYDKDGKDITPEEGIEITPKDLSVNSTNYSVATAEATVDWQGKNVKAKAIYPIAWRSEVQYVYNGPVYIYYDSNNTNPTYNQVLELISASNRIADWKLQSNDTSDTRQHYNFKIEINEKAVLLKVPSLYTSELKDAQICIVALIDNEIVYKQPIIITQNQWSSQLLNEWNGELAIDNEGNYILSAMLGAGKKNADNTFTGVVMGDISSKLNDSTMVTTGLYGLQDGVQTFGLKTDGTGFIGSNIGGRIEFDGQSSIIKSSNWSGKYNQTGFIEDTTEGMAIHLSAGQISTKGVFINGEPDIPDQNDTNKGVFFSLGLNKELQYKYLSRSQNLYELVITKAILRSTDWDGIYGGLTTDSEAENDSSEDINNKELGIITSGSQGMAIDLSSGKIDGPSIIFGSVNGENYQAEISSNGGFTIKNGISSKPFCVISTEDTHIVSNNFKITGTSTAQNKILFQYVARDNARTGNKIPGNINIRSGPNSSYKSIGKTKSSEQEKWYCPASIKNSGKWYPIYINDDGNQLSEMPSNLKAEPRYGYIWLYGGSEGEKLFKTESSAKIDYTENISQETIEVDGSSFSLESSGGHLIFAEQGDRGGYIILGNNPNDSTYALQIGKFKVKWDGTVEQ